MRSWLGHGSSYILRFRVMYPDPHFVVVNGLIPLDTPSALTASWRRFGFSQGRCPFGLAHVGSRSRGQQIIWAEGSRGQVVCFDQV